MAQPTLILFDVDGTLVDTAGAGRLAIERAFEEVFGIEAITEKTSRVRFAGMTDSSIFESLAVAAEIEPSRFDAQQESLHRSYLLFLDAEMKRHEPRRRIMPGVKPLLEALRSRRDACTGLLTGNLEVGARIKLEPFGLNPFFRGGGFGSDHADRRQVALAAWNNLRELTGIDFPASRVVVVGDTERDVDCGHANGFRAVAVESGWVPRSTLEAARPDALFQDLTDLPAVLLSFGLTPD